MGDWWFLEDQLHNTKQQSKVWSTIIVVICVYSYALCNHDVILYYMHACVQKQ